MDSATPLIIKTEPEFIICHNDDDFEIAHDPFALDDGLIEPKKEEDDEEIEAVEAPIVGLSDDDNVELEDSHHTYEDTHHTYDDSHHTYEDSHHTDDDEQKETQIPLVIKEEPPIEIPNEIVSQESSATDSKAKQPIRTVDRKTKCASKKVINKDKPQPQHQCPDCDKRFKYNSSLQIHIRTHTGEKIFQCPICEKKFSRSHHYKTHIESVHAGEEYKEAVMATAHVKCEVCGKVFTHSGNFKTHMKIHNGIRNFQCPLCDKAFVLSQHLKSHVKLIHTDEKSFQCNICGKLFNHAGNHKKHMRTHSGEKPFKCTLCDKAFGQSSNYRAHMRVHMGDRPFKCTLCDRAFIQSVNLTLHMRVSI